MRDIKKIEIGKAQNVDLKAGKAEKAEPQFCGEVEEPTIKDFSNPTAEALGRSQVSGADNLKADIAFGITNPKVINSSNKLFDLTYAQLTKENDPQAYEKACTIATSDEAKELFSR
jgi:hypothetical protein